MDIDEYFGVINPKIDVRRFELGKPPPDHNDLNIITTYVWSWYMDNDYHGKEIAFELSVCLHMAIEDSCYTAAKDIVHQEKELNLAGLFWIIANEHGYEKIFKLLDEFKKEGLLPQVIELLQRKFDNQDLVQ